MHKLSFNSLIVFVFRNEEKLVALLLYSSFNRVATSMIQKFPHLLVGAVKSGKLSAYEE